MGTLIWIVVDDFEGIIVGYARTREKAVDAAVKYLRKVGGLCEEDYIEAETGWRAGEDEVGVDVWLEEIQQLGTDL